MQTLAERQYRRRRGPRLAGHRLGGDGLARFADRPQKHAMRFLCDAMLGRLARWLRAAGYDSALAEGGWLDRALVDICIREDRVLLTKDRELALLAGAAVSVLLLDGRTVDANARELGERLGVDWRHAPFTRCLVDNALLEPADPHHAEQVPPTSRSLADPLRRCPACRRLYWPGGHVRRMQRRLALWQGLITH